MIYKTTYLIKGLIFILGESSLYGGVVFKHWMVARGPSLNILTWKNCKVSNFL